jgi:hypothetical protein
LFVATISNNTRQEKPIFPLELCGQRFQCSTV